MEPSGSSDFSESDSEYIAMENPIKSFCLSRRKWNTNTRFNYKNVHPSDGDKKVMQTFLPN